MTTRDRVNNRKQTIENSTLATFLSLSLSFNIENKPQNNYDNNNPQTQQQTTTTKNSRRYKPLLSSLVMY